MTLTNYLLLIPWVLLVIANRCWAIHDLYFWDVTINKEYQGRWHIVKSFLKIYYTLSAVLFGRFTASVGWLNLGLLLVLYAAVYWGAFEFWYNVYSTDKTTRVFDGWRYLCAALNKKEYGGFAYTNFPEFVLHHCFRLHWSEAVMVSICTLIIGALL